MLYVVAWPLLSEADDTALRRLRAQYHSSEAEMIGPHFTLVFGAPAEREPALREALATIDRRPFWFLIDRIARHDHYLFAEPSDGAAELTELYDALNPTPGPVPFEPHITLGLFARAAEAEQVARIVGRQHLPIHGRVEALALLQRTDQGLDTLLTVRLE
ncbi:MAG: 2'-5' RNA ligase family protein [Reyranella sp.]|uniref:2'-5' RNA ligase family protein n=1 Tax=Reyranella sp. TaxID=1929291 RepID=UPI001ACEE6BF|nr:2'-5' RNA ligase family protein [Reyranella sp.]MBN9089037.1 2'-5' RNA ligase family protein [Reyranella sp.]